VAEIVDVAARLLLFALIASPVYLMLRGKSWDGR